MSHKPTFDVPWHNRRDVMRTLEDETSCAAIEQNRIAGLYMDDLEAKIAEQDALILEQSDRIIELEAFKRSVGV